MSLLAWYPLNKNYENHGLDGIDMNPMGDIALTENSIFGKGLSCVGDASKCLYRDGFKLIKDFTWCCWVKVNNKTSDRYSFILSEGRNYVNFGFNIIYESSTSEIRLMIGGESSGNKTHIIYKINIGQWYHIAITVEESAVSSYVNGKLVSTNSYSVPDYTSSYDAFTIGKMSHWYTNDTLYYFPLDGVVNDVRVYDNVLSVKEIREIAKGLVLHYPMNQMDKPKNNLVDVDSFTTGVGAFATATSGYYKDFMTGASVYKSRLNIVDSSSTSKWFIVVAPIKYEYFTVGKKYLIEFWLRCNNDVDKYFYIKYGNGENNIFGDNFHMSAKANTWTKMSAIGTCILKPDENSRLYISGSTAIDKYTMEIRGPMVVECDSDILDITYTPDYGSSDQWFDGIEYDTSGFDNHGTIPSEEDNMPYSAYSSVGPCYDFNSEKRYILGQNPLLLNSAVSFSFWIYYDSTIPFVGAPCVFTARTAVGVGLAFFLYGSTSIRFDTGSGVTSVSYEISKLANAWHHIALTRDLSLKKIYIDGELVNSSNIVGIMDGIASTISIGCSSSGYANMSSTNFFAGKLKDFRMYVTALSAEDVKALYQTKQMITDRSVLLSGEIINHD